MALDELGGVDGLPENVCVWFCLWKYFHTSINLDDKTQAINSTRYSKKWSSIQKQTNIEMKYIKSLNRETKTEALD